MAPTLSHNINTTKPGAKLGENALATSVLEADGATTEHALLSPHKEATHLFTEKARPKTRKHYRRHNHSRINKWTPQQAAQFANTIFRIFGLELVPCKT